MVKKCRRCNQIKEHSKFTIAKSNLGGYSHICKACIVLRNIEYWRTPQGRISTIYAHQITSSKHRGHIPPQYSRKELTSWAIKNGLEILCNAWKISGYLKELAPSIDRLNPNEGYSLLNIRLVTWNDNNEKAYEDRKSCAHITKQNKRVEQLSLNGEHISYYDSVALAARVTGGVRTNINRMCAGASHIKSVKGFLWRYA